MYTIGTHMSIAKGIAKAAENVAKMEANTMQIFNQMIMRKVLHHVS